MVVAHLFCTEVLDPPYGEVYRESGGGGVVLVGGRGYDAVVTIK